MKNKAILKGLTVALNLFANHLSKVLAKTDLSEKRRSRLIHVLEVVQVLQSLLPLINAD